MEAEYSEQRPQAAHGPEPEHVIDNAPCAGLAQQDLVPDESQSDESMRDDSEKDPVLENGHWQSSVQQQQSCGQPRGPTCGPACTQDCLSHRPCVSMGPCSGL